MAVRVDKWLWAVRVYKTRTRSTKACSEGLVKVNDVVVKPSAKVDEGDVVTAVRGRQTIIYVVLEPISKRVSAPRAAACVEDRSPPPPPRTDLVPPVFAKRDPGTGRPTKRDRREIDRLRGRRD